MLPTDNLGLEADRSVRWFSRVGHGYAITLRISTDANHTAIGRQRSRDGNEGQGRLGTVAGIMVGIKTNGGLAIWFGGRGAIFSSGTTKRLSGSATLRVTSRLGRSHFRPGSFVAAATRVDDDLGGTILGGLSASQTGNEAQGPPIGVRRMGNVVFDSRLVRGGGSGGVKGRQRLATMINRA